jgi:hypothetical protein
MGETVEDLRQELRPHARSERLAREGSGDIRGSLSVDVLEALHMVATHPLLALQSDLEAARHRAIDALAAVGEGPDLADLQELATLQTALTAVREEIAAHSPKVGWAADGDLD